MSLEEKPICTLDTLRNFTDEEKLLLRTALRTFCSSHVSTLITVVRVTGLKDSPASEYTRIGEWLMLHSGIRATQPSEFYIKFATNFDVHSGTVDLIPVSFCSHVSNQYAALVSRLLLIVGQWCDSFDPETTMLCPLYRGVVSLGKGQYAPDIVVLLKNQGPRMIIQIEDEHGSIMNLRQCIHDWFSYDTTQVLQAVLAIKVTGTAASAVLYERDGIHGHDSLMVRAHYDFGRNN